MNLLNIFIKTATLAAILTISSCTEKATETPWQSLFDGTSLDQWEVRNGKAPYVIQDSTIVGTAILDSPNTFLCTKEMYSDFILELDFKCDSPLNSGIQIRSNAIASYNDGAVHGYQVEIDPSERAWSGGIYEEGVRGWLYPLVNNPKGQAAYKKDEWNHYRIEAIGEDIRVWSNGVATTNLKDNETASGFIGLQVHSIGQDSSMVGKQVRWRNVRVLTSELEQHRNPFGLAATEVNITKSISQAERNQGYEQIDTETIKLDSLQHLYVLGEFAPSIDLKFQFMMQKNSSAGISFGHIDSDLIYQIIDNELITEDDSHLSLASLKGKISSQNLSVPGRQKDYRGHNRWNTGRISLYEGELKFWMNEQLMVDTTIDEELKNSMFLFLERGEVAFRGLRVRELD